MVLLGLNLEFSLATPSALASGEAALPTEVFLSPKSVGSTPDIKTIFSHEFRGGEISEWPTGWFYSGWGPFNSRNATLPQEQVQSEDASIALGRAILNG